MFIVHHVAKGPMVDIIYPGAWGEKGRESKEMSAEHTRRNKKKSTGQVPEMKIWPH